MKLKEKINNEINSNEGFVIMKKLWQNKRYRSVFWLILYFIFFFVIISSLRTSYQNQPVNPETTNRVINVSEILTQLDDYSYEITLNTDTVLINGKVVDNTNTFVYENENYTIVGNNIYLEQNSNLIKADLTDDIVIPINKIMVNEIEKYIQDSTPIGSQDVATYNLSLSNMIEGETISFAINFYGEDKIEKIELDFSEYIKLKELEYEEYILTIKLGDENNDNSSR